MLSRDVESHQIHMLVSKPISRVKIWLGKCLGVIAIHVFLLFVSAILVYLAIMYNFNRKNFSAEEKEQIRNEVLIGRRLYARISGHRRPCEKSL